MPLPPEPLAAPTFPPLALAPGASPIAENSLLQASEMTPAQRNVGTQDRTRAIVMWNSNSHDFQH
jgi:hypothetical protein